MGDRQTIADSKRAFHQRFPYVIAPLYRRLADELLVELHLLSHQKQFKSNALFAVGLDAVFRSFTKGYRPDEHPALLFDALCSSNGFQAEALKQEATATLEQARAQSETDLSAWLQQFALADNSHYSRLMAIGLFSLFGAAGALGASRSPACSGRTCTVAVRPTDNGRLAGRLSKTMVTGTRWASRTH